MDWIKRIFYALVDFFKKPEVQQLIIQIVENIVAKKFGGQLQPMQGLTVYGMAMEKLRTRVGEAKANASAYQVARQIDKYTTSKKEVQTALSFANKKQADSA